MARKIPSDAFDVYFALGTERSYQALADKYGVTKKAITLAAKRERWQQRILELEAKAREASDQKIRESLEERTERNLTRLRFIQAKAIETLKRVPIESAMDAVRAFTGTLREERVILGEPTDRTAVTIEDVIKREYERWMVPVSEESEEPGEIPDADAGESEERDETEQ